MLNRTRLASALLALSGVVACGGTVRVEPGGSAGAAPLAQGGAPGSAGPPAMGAGSGNLGNSGSSAAGGGAPNSITPSGEAGETGTCLVDGVVHPVGVPFGCDCNTCWCDPGGQVSSTLIECNTTCAYAGERYSVGQAFPARDGCNKCECQSSGQVSCSEINCACQPDREWYRHYIGSSVACTLADFVCPAHTTAFGNECGCGCEEDVICPQWVDCEPGNPTCESMKLACPYSQIAF